MPTTSPPSRIASLDVMRGAALLGMIVVHFHQRTRLPELPHAAFPGEWLVGWVVWVGVEAKAWALFALLFGAGFALLVRSTEARGESIVQLYLRRLLVLAAFGVAIEVLTGFKVLLEYAVWAVPLLFARRWPTQRLLALAGLAAASYWLAWLAVELMPQASGAAVAAAAQPASYFDVVRQRFARLPSQYLSWRFLGTAVSLSMFILGYLAVRHGCVAAPLQHRRTLALAGALGLLSWAMYWLVLYRLPGTSADQPLWTALRYGFGLIREQWLGITYASVMILALASGRSAAGRAALISDAGRMPLSNYALQAIIVEALSSPFGLGLRLRPFAYLSAAVLLFVAQALVSRWWLGRFRRGPLEWVWRAATAARPLPAHAGGPSVDPAPQ